MEVTKKQRQNSPLGVCYVEVNGSNFGNAGCYSVGGPETPLFDIAIIFAANINYNVSQQKAYLHFNQNVDRVLSNVNQYVRPLQAKGIKVLLSILGNHEGAGFCNFQTVEAARNFAVELKDAVERYGLDGIDFDDEYADYGNNGTGQPNQYSFIYLLRELRAVMPNKIISFYFYGPAASRLSWAGQNAGDFLDYSWNAMYGTWSPPNVPGLGRDKMSASAVWINHTSQARAEELATQTINEGYGCYLYYDLPNSNANNWLSGVSNRLYRVSSTVAGGCLATWPPQDAEDDSARPALPMRDFNRP